MLLRFTNIILKVLIPLTLIYSPGHGIKVLTRKKLQQKVFWLIVINWIGLKNIKNLLKSDFRKSGFWPKRG